ncbi:MAG: methyltransferase domain-containing protein [Gammaproteobacteria bacterium]|nr:methyltransferase domain-containing protein [Gammaproteobacteria bacterium]
MSKIVGNLGDKTILDLGCATGGLTLMLADEGGYAVGLDSQLTNVLEATKRELPEKGRIPAFVQGDAIQLPFRRNAFDVILLSGLLEWMGFARPEAPPKDAQLETLEQVHRSLSPGGYVFVGIENRWFPKFLARSPHQRLPFAMLLPSRLAWTLPGWVFGDKVHECLHGHRGLRRLLETAGFDRVEIHIPLFGYHFPREIAKGDDRRAVLAAVERTRRPARSRLERVASGGRWGRAWFSLIAALGLQLWLAPAFIAVARKPKKL